MILRVPLLLAAVAFFCLAAVRDVNDTVDWWPLGWAAVVMAAVLSLPEVAARLRR
jgi:hypothetical protein